MSDKEEKPIELTTGTYKVSIWRIVMGSIRLLKSGILIFRVK